MNQPMHGVLKKGALAKIWLASHFEKKLSKQALLNTSIITSVRAILGEAAAYPYALRLSGQLLLGVVRIYSRKARYLLEDCNDALVKIKMAFKPGMVDMPQEQIIANPSTITIPDAIIDEDLLFRDAPFDFRQFMEAATSPLPQSQESMSLPPPWQNVSKLEDITLKEHPSQRSSFYTDFANEVGRNNLFHDEAGFIDFGFDDEALLQQHRFSSQTPLKSRQREQDESVEIGRHDGDISRRGSIMGLDTSSIQLNHDTSEPFGEIAANKRQKSGTDLMNFQAEFPPEGVGFGAAAGVASMDLEDIGEIRMSPLATPSKTPVAMGFDGRMPDTDRPFEEMQPEDGQMFTTPSKAAKKTKNRNTVLTTPRARAGTQKSALKRKNANKIVSVLFDNQIELSNIEIREGLENQSDIMIKPVYESLSDRESYYRQYLKIGVQGWLDIPNSRWPEKLARTTRFCLQTRGIRPLLQPELFSNANIFEEQWDDKVVQKRDTTPFSTSQKRKSSTNLPDMMEIDEGAGVLVGESLEHDHTMGDFTMDENIHGGNDDLWNEVDQAPFAKKSKTRVNDADEKRPQINEEEEEGLLPMSMHTPISKRRGPPASASKYDFDAQGQDDADNTESAAGLSKHTLHVMKVLKDRFNDAEEGEDIIFTDFAKKTTRMQRVKFFFELLVLKSKDMIEVEQEEAYGDIRITPKIALLA
ncbi:hypothetical protein SeLEV6574_g03157 [Synchytrium endobioticum]|nr:hypothetical protein SeLEV6574_g03157 [Synchytrium endobioticum]